MSATVLVGDCLVRLAELPDNSVDSVVCDPPYHLTSGNLHYDWSPKENRTRREGRKPSKGFMGQTWDGGDIAFQPDTWAEVLRVVKPGGHLLAFSGTRTYHRMAVAIEDAGFEVRDMIAWHYGSGFPKSHDISKAIDKAAGAEREVVGPSAYAARANKTGRAVEPGGEGKRAHTDTRLITSAATDAAREWEGWGTALKPATEPICVARKPLSEKSIAANVLKWGTGAINVDGCRIATDENLNGGAYAESGNKSERSGSMEGGLLKSGIGEYQQPTGRWPANLCHDGSDEVVAGFPDEAGGDTARGEARPYEPNGKNAVYGQNMGGGYHFGFGDSGSAARFFYCAKAGRLDRLGSDHPTVKPVQLMRWLVRLVTPPGGTVLDPFAGTGSTGIAALIEGFETILIELREEAADDIKRRLDHIRGLGRMTVLELAAKDLADEEKARKAQGGGLPLFGEP